MGASKKIKKALYDKDILQMDFAQMLGYKSINSFYNMLSRDNMTFAVVERWADALGCDIVLKDRETGKIYE